MSDPKARLFYGFFFDPDQPHPWDGVDFEEWLSQHATPLGIEIGIHGDISSSVAYHYAFVKESARIAWVRPAFVRTDMTHHQLVAWTHSLREFAKGLGLELTADSYSNTEKPYMIDWYLAADA